MEKINLRMERSFSDSITVTFNFMKQEFVPLIKAFAVIALPLIFVDFFTKSYMVRSSFQLLVDSGTEGRAYSDLGITMLNYLVSVILFFWMMLFGISYMRVYIDKYQEQDEGKVQYGEVWRMMGKHMGKVFGWWLMYMLLVVAGCIFFIIPGIYLGATYLPAAFFLVLQDKKVGESMGRSKDLLQGKWWNFFGYLLLFQLMVGVLSYVFSIPTMILTVKTVFTHEIPGVYETTFGMMVGSLGQNFLQIVFIVGIGIRFLTFVEQKEHGELLSKIDRIGQTEQPVQREEVL